MELNSITGNLSVLTTQTLPKAVSLEQPLKAVISVSDQSSKPSNQLVKTSTDDANANAIVSSVNKQKPVTGVENSKKQIRSMSHIVETYNLQGKVRTKFMDSNNNVIYQIPTEMVAKMEDQMMKPETAANVSG